MKILIKGGNVVTSKGVYQKDILIDNETIVEIGINLSSIDAEVIDAKDCFIFAGAIDSHTHFDLHTGETKSVDDFESGSKAALIGGTTTIIDFITQYKSQTLEEALERWHEKATGKTYCDYGFHMGITDWNDNTKKEMNNMLDKGISTFKMYMAYEGLRVSDKDIYEALCYGKEIGALVGFHCENGDLADALVKKNLQEGNTTPYYHMMSRPEEVEIEAIFRLLSIAKVAKAPVWVVHLSTGKGLEIVIEARRNGQDIIIETCPQYLLLNTEKYGEPYDESFESAKYVMSPPLRRDDDREKLWQGIKNGDVDFISTDHCSFNLKGQKELGIGDFSRIPNGSSGVEDRVLLMYTYGVCEKRISLEKMAEILSEEPAKKMGLSKKGFIEVEMDADLFILNPNYEDVFTVTKQTQRSDYNGYEGMLRKGKIETVFLRGTKVVSNGKLIYERPNGKYQFRRKLIWKKQ